MDQRVGQAKPLLHPAGQSIHICVPLFLQMHQRQQLLRHPGPLLFLNTVAPGIKIQILPGLQVIIHAEKIRHISHQGPGLFPVFADLHPVNQRPARGGGQEGGQNTHGGGFARAIGAHKAMQLAIPNVQAQMIQRQKLPVALGQFFDLQHVISPSLPASAWAFAHSIRCRCPGAVRTAAPAR